jgi:hypothetical protein
MTDGDTPGTVEVTVVDRVVGLAAFTLAIVLLRCLPFRATLATARALKYLGRRPASTADAQRAIAGRDWAAHGRIPRMDRGRQRPDRRA